MTKNVVIMGGSGFLGKSIGQALSSSGYRIHILTRTVRSNSCYQFPCVQIDSKTLDGLPEDIYMLINLAGEPIGDGVWTRNKRKKILESRVESAKLAVKISNEHSVSILIQSSATGYYGSNSVRMEEGSPNGKGFLAETAFEWEKPIVNVNPGTRTIIMRLGVVIGKSGGFSEKMKSIYKLKLGASLGGGKHRLSWIHEKDVVTFVCEASEDTTYSGIYNLVAPNSATYKELHVAFTKELGGLPWLNIPKALLKAMFGKKSELFLSDQDIAPSRLIDKGFKFKFHSIENAIQDVLAI